MEIRMLSVVKLKDGTEGTIVEVWKDGEGYEFEPDDHSDFDDGAPLTYAIRRDDISAIIDM